VVDAVLRVAELPYDGAGGPLAGIPDDERWVLITVHRRESFGAPLAEVCRAIRELSERFREERVQFIYPVHLNPNVDGPVRALLGDIPNVHLLPPLDYLSLVQLMKRCTLILTDSGGIQEEAPAFGVPVLVLREVTERPEGIAAGVARLVGTDRGRIVREATTLLQDAAARAAMSAAANPYGDGKAAERIVAALLAWETS